MMGTRELLPFMSVRDILMPNANQEGASLYSRLMKAGFLEMGADCVISTTPLGEKFFIRRENTEGARLYGYADMIPALRLHLLLLEEESGKGNKSIFQSFKETFDG